MAPSPRSSTSTRTESFPDAPDLTLDVPSPGVATTASAPPALAPTSSSGRRRDSHVRYAPDPDRPPQSAHSGRRTSVASPASPSAATAQLRRRATRSNTFETLDEFDEFHDGERAGWRPGAEPGIDPLQPDGGHPGSVPDLHARCQITVVDFSKENLEVHELWNEELVAFVKQPKPSWVQCRWISVNGLSWDVIQALGQYKNLHRLAIEDIMNRRNRTKVDWYANHAFIILTCQKLVRIVNDDSSDSSDSDSGDDDDKRSTMSIGSFKNARRKLKKWATWKQQPSSASVLEKGKSRRQPSATAPGLIHQPNSMSNSFSPSTLTTLQRYHASNNEVRTEFMERHSALEPRGLAVAAEQVSIVISDDNDVIAFFEQSADDCEEPILARLRSPTTILRQSCDASMVAQAIIDAIIDMAIPVTACYADVIGDLELDVLTHPNINHTKRLYIIISELNKMFSFVTPIQTIINALRDHKAKLAPGDLTRALKSPSDGVIISPMAYTYLGDVLDHCMLISENLNQIKASANHMIDLIFNTIATYQNESMKQLTTATIFFLPLTFITGYFGQNFVGFDAIQGDVLYFWKVAIPVCFATVLIMMRLIIWEWLVTFFQRRHILGARKTREEKLKKARRDRKLKAAKIF